MPSTIAVYVAGVAGRSTLHVAAIDASDAVAASGSTVATVLPEGSTIVSRTSTLEKPAGPATASVVGPPAVKVNASVSVRVPRSPAVVVPTVIAVAPRGPSAWSSVTTGAIREISATSSSVLVASAYSPRDQWEARWL